MNLQTKIVLNKFYKYADTIVKVKKITRNLNKVYVTDLTSKQELILPYENAELIMHRIYTIGEIAKIVEKRSDTIRKYEKEVLFLVEKNSVKLVKVIKTGATMKDKMFTIWYHFLTAERLEDLSQTRI